MGKTEARFGRCREMGGGMLLVFDWHETREETEKAIVPDTPVRQFVIEKLEELNIEGCEAAAQRNIREAEDYYWDDDDDPVAFGCPPDMEAQ